MMKRVRFIATHSYFIEELDAQCDGSHQHEPVQGSNTAASACYPPFLADAICRAFWRVVEQEDFGTQTFNEEENYKTAWFVDADKSEDKWRPLFEEAMEVLGRKNQGSIFVPPDSPLYAKISALVPWQIMNIQLAHLPKAKRVRPGLEECHRCSVLLHADDSLTAEPAPQQEPLRQSVQADPTVDLESPILTKQSVGPPLNNKQKKLAPILAKLHKNLGHPSQADLTRALIQDGTVEPDAIELSRRLRCATCERTKKPGIPRPTSFKVIGSFNSKLCLDFVYAPDANKDNFAFLHILEPNGSFNVFWPCPTREPGQIFDLVTLLWCSWAGFPKELWIDQDGAFQGEFAERMRNMGVNIDCPPAEAHWQVGQIEAYNRAFQHVASKLVDALNLAGERDMRTLACAVCAAMNDRIRSAGCSAYQWVFGKSPVLPQDILSPDGKFEALQAMELDDELKKRARTRALADEKLSAYRLNEAVRTAILRKSHPAKELYHPGELVAFWREAKYRQGKKGQKGKRIPASWYRGTIIGPHKGDSSVKQSNYWVASGGRCVLVAREQLRPAFGTELWPVHEHILQEFQENPPDKYYDLRSRDLPPVPEDDDLKDGEDQIPLFQDDDSVFNDLIDEFPEEQEAEMETGEADQHPPPPEPDGAASTGSDLTTLAAGTSTRAPGTPVTGIIRPPSSREESLAPPKRLKTTPSGSQASNPPEESMVLEPATPPGEHNVELVHTDDKWKWLPDRALLLRQHLRPRRALYDPGRVRALPLPLDKWRTKRVTWMKTDTGWTKHVDDWVQRGAEVMGKVWTGVTIFSIIDKKSHVMAIHNVLEMQSEISRKERKALEKELPWSAIPEDQRELYRQALVKEWTTWLRYEAVRVLSWDCSRQVELSFDPARILAARVCYRDKHAATPWGIFGLANSPRLFWRHLRDSMVKLGFMQSTLDKAVFLFYQDKRLVVAVGAHVDDLLCVGEPGVGDKVLERLRAQFDFGEWKDIREEPTLIYGGKEISKKGDIITLSQEAFIRALTLTPVPKWRTIMKDSALNAQETTELKSGGGCLHWLVGQTRPDLAAGTSLNMGGNPTIQNLLAINNLLKEALKSKDWALQFRPLDLTKARIIGFSDASWANTDDLKSQAGYLVFITGPEVFTLAGDVANLVEWRSHRIRRKCRSTLAAETMGLDAATDAVLFTRELLAEMLIESYQPTQSGRLAPEIFPAATATDCRSLYDLLVKDGPLGSTQEKRLTLDIGALREAAEELEPSGENVKDVYKWVSTHVQRADHLTKIKPQHELRKILDEGHLSMVAAE
ncbi:Retrovirus-related Pol polyprotein from transposon RE2 (Retro element 2) (AtRE2) [Includes: Protease RE2, partial [Durusdinium trenchii]